MEQSEREPIKTKSHFSQNICHNILRRIFLFLYITIIESEIICALSVLSVLLYMHINHLILDYHIIMMCEADED